MSLLALQDIFRRVRDKATGIWRLGQEPNRTIYFDSGDIVFAQSTHPLDRLTHLLVERGKLTQPQLDYAMANLKPGLSIGKNLIEMGFITQRDLLEVARAQVERVVWGALGTDGEAPTFDEGPLDATVVHLPLDCPHLLLGCLLNLQDRERLLELLGPLNQVVVLQTRRLSDMALPQDLAKLPPLLDGTRTLRELSQQGLAEPQRLGAFVLLLRELGWARLHEMPPLDRKALDRVLDPEPEPLSPPLPEAPAAAGPSLFSTIEAAARPTTNLEHLSQALDELDQLPPPEPLQPEETPESLEPLEPLEEWPEEQHGFQPGPDLPETVASGPREEPSSPWNIQAETGQAHLPTPSVELPPIPDVEEPPVPEALPPLRVAPAEFEPVPPAPDFQEESQRRRVLPALLIVLLAAALGLGGWYAWKRYKARRPAPAPAPARTEPPKPVSPRIEAPAAGPAQTEAPQLEPAKNQPPRTEPARTEPPAPKQAAPEPLSHTLESRLECIRRGEFDKALRQGQARLKALGGRRWVLRLEIACQGDTVRHALELFPGGKPDLFLLPMTLRDGRACYQVMLGDFPSQAAAEKQVKRLPAAFRSQGNRPRAFRTDGIPSRQ